MSAALKKEQLSAAMYAQMIDSTTRLNTPGPDLAALEGVHALTDVTGFGLAGHALEMARGAGLTAVIDWSQVPLLPGIEAMAKSIAEQPAIQLTMAARQAFGNVPQDKRESVAKAIDADLKKYTDEAVPLLRDRAIKLSPSVIGTEIENNFNEAELKQLIEWMESPVTKRFNSLAPGMQRTLGEKLVTDTRGQIEPKLKTLENAMARQLGLPPAPEGGAAPAGGPPMPGVRGGDAKK
jgi:hypothetical protein